MGRLMGSSNSNNYGEQIFINKASEYLDDANIIYWNRQLFGKEFDVCILMPEKGILVVELKGWREENILRIENNDSVIIQTNDGEVSASPQKQARGYRFSIERHIRQNIGKFPLVYQMVCLPQVSKAFFKSHRLDVVMEEMQKLFEVVKGTRLELPVLVAAFYGLRRGEVLGLKWDAIDFNRGTLTIKRTVTEATIDGTMKIIEQDSAKTKSSLRTLPLVGSFRDYFQKVKEAQELNKKVCGNCYNYEYDGYVFVNELGERMRPNYLTEYFPKYIAKHGMPKMRFHDLRHSCASLLLANGVPLKQIQEWLGHSDFSTTANIYAHLDYRSKISSAQAMEQGMLLPRSDDFGSRWENVTEQGKITEPDLNPVF